MRFLGLVTRIVILVVVLLLIAQAEARARQEWSGKLKDGTAITESDLAAILDQHESWRATNGKRGKVADLRGADLRKADWWHWARGAAFRATRPGGGAGTGGVTERPPSRTSIWLKDADLRGANLREADLTKAWLKGADLRGADLTRTWLEGVDLRGADLTGAILYGTSLKYANLFEANITGATFWGAYVSGLIYQPKLGGLPYVASISTAKGLSRMTYDQSPHAMVELREAFKNTGLRDQERQLTYAIKHNERLKTYSPVWSFFTYLLFELPSGWGMHPGRPLLIMLVLVPVFFILYLFSLFHKGQNGIWRRWLPDRVRTDQGQKEKERLEFKLGNWRAYTYALYFSLLSAFHIGWRDLNVGNWITRMQPNEYTLRATGWVRTVSGIQSLISVYLLALAILTYFGRPFG
jgi:pentapeptide repeat protein